MVEYNKVFNSPKFIFLCNCAYFLYQPSYSIQIGINPPAYPNWGCLIKVKINLIFNLVIYRNKADMDCSSGSVDPVSIDDKDSQTKNMGSSSSSLASCSSEGSINGGSSQRNLFYKKSLTFADVYFSRLMIPLESAAIDVLLGPEKCNGRYERILISLLDQI